MKSYFYFPKNIRNGILIFILLMIVIVAVKFICSKNN